MFGPQVGNMALGAGIGCFATLFNINAINNHYDYTSAVLTTSTLMGGVGYCIGVLTGSSSPRIVAISFAAINLISCLCCYDYSSKYESYPGRSFLWNTLSCCIPLATGMAALTQNSLLNGYCASGLAISVIALFILPQLPVRSCLSGLVNCVGDVVGGVWNHRDRQSEYYIGTNSKAYTSNYYY